MKKIIEYFSNKHILINFLVIFVFVGGVAFWNSTGKEDLPNIQFDFARISGSYSGATAEEVDYYITKPVEEAISGIDGIRETRSSTGQGSCVIFLDLDPKSSNRDNVIEDINTAVNGIRFPDDVEVPNVREFKSNRRAVIDIALYYRDIDILSDNDRKKLEAFSDTLESRISRLPTVSEIDTTNYLDGFIEIKIDTDKLQLYDISITEVINIIKRSNVKQPIGTLSDDLSTRIRMETDITEIDRLRNIVIRDTFDGVFYRLRDIADVSWVVEDRNSIYKVNGSEAVTLRVTKTSSAGILESTDSIKKVVKEFEASILPDTGVDLVIISDQSEDVRNRLSLITSNGILGFVLIILMLFIFLDAKSGFWVAMGIPFTLACTMIIASLLGNTINNMTLAAVIIVLGMVVDDAIVVAENVSRLHSHGMLLKDAVTEGTMQVFSPIVASITTTCVAFIPLFFFHGRFGTFTSFLPGIIFLMLGSSLFEALFVLPAHLRSHIPPGIKNVLTFGLHRGYTRMKEKAAKRRESKAPGHVHWFLRVEEVYGRILEKILNKKYLIYIVLTIVGIFACIIFFSGMKYSMFPREETTDFYLSGEVAEGKNKFETEEFVRSIEKVLEPYLGRELICFRTSIARSRRGNSSQENTFTINAELVPRQKRKKPSKVLNAEWQEAINKLQGFYNLRFARNWFGQSSGSAIDILVQENDNKKRNALGEDILAYLKRMPSLKNAEIERELTRPQYILKINKDVIYKLNINADSITGMLRTLLQGTNVFDMTIDGKDIDVIVSINPGFKKSLDSLLSIPIRISNGLHIPMNKLVTVEKDNRPDSIQKLNGKQTLHVYADLNDKNGKAPAQQAWAGQGASENTGNNQPDKNQNNGTDSGENQKSESEKRPDFKNNESLDKSRERGQDEKNEEIEMLDLPAVMTPLEIAKYLEENLFPVMYRKYASSDISFAGEIEDTHESTQDFSYAILFTVLFIYMILALTLNSLKKPFIILLAIPFGVVGIIFALSLHGMMVYGFFSVVGALGLAGVIVNDSIVLLNKLDREYDKPEYGTTHREKVANIAKTRLRAVLLTTFTTVAGLLPTAYGVFGYDSMLAEMMLTMAWGLMFGTVITLVLVPAIYCSGKEMAALLRKIKNPPRKSY